MLIVIFRCFDDIFDGRHTGQGLFGETEAVGHRSDQLVINIQGAAAHAGDDSASFEFGRFQFHPDQILIRHKVFNETEYLETEGFNLCPLEDGLSDPFHPRFYLG